MRAAVPGLPTAVPLSAMLPGIFQEDPFTVRFVSGFDDVLAPILSTLDCLPAYFDPSLAPEDFLGWLAGWVGLSLDENWPLERRRDLVARNVPCNWLVEEKEAQARAAQEGSKHFVDRRQRVAFVSFLLSHRPLPSRMLPFQPALPDPHPKDQIPVSPIP